MKIPSVKVGQVQSVGRRNLGAVGGVDAAQQKLEAATTGAIQAGVKLVDQYATRKLEMEAEKNKSEAFDNITDFVKNYSARDAYDAEELKGLGLEETIRMTDTGNDDAGNSVEHLRKNIPAYEVYPALLDNKLKSVKESYAKNITSPKLRKDFESEMDEIYRQETLKTVVSAERAQLKQQKTDTEARAISYAMNGDKESALKQYDLFKGTDKEREDLRLKIDQVHEQEKYGEARRTNNVLDLLKYKKELMADDYAKKGSLGTDQNLVEQAKIDAKLGKLRTNSKSIDRMQKAQTVKTANNTITSLEDGVLNGLDSVGDIGTALLQVQQEALALKVADAARRAPAVVEMYQTNPALHDKIIDKNIAQNFKGVNANAAREILTAKSEEIAARQFKDGTGVFVERIVDREDIPGVNDENYFSTMLAYSKRAKLSFNIGTKPLPEKVARSLSDRLKNQTVPEKMTFVQTVASQVSDKGDLNAIFKQLDSEGANDLTVYADILDRDLGSAIETISIGQSNRLDKTLKLLPKDIDTEINTQLFTAFSNPVERQAYVELVKDYYAGKTKKHDPNKTDKNLLKESIAVVAGSVVNYRGETFLLPNNTIGADGFNRWVRRTSSRYIDELGGIQGMESPAAMQAIRDGDLTFSAASERGQWKLKDVEGNYVNYKAGAVDEDGAPLTGNFIFKYRELRPVRQIGRAASKGGGNL